MNYTHILLATDFSGISEAAAKRASSLAKLMGAKLSLLHVIEHYPEDRSEDVIPPETADPRLFFIKQAKNELDVLVDTLVDNGQDRSQLASDVVLTSGSAGREIAHYASQHGADLIVMGTHGKHGLMGRLGSTSNSVMHDAKRDVLVVRQA